MDGIYTGYSDRTQQVIDVLQGWKIEIREGKIDNRCKGCGKRGHRIEVCQRNVVCEKCGEKGHVERRCLKMKLRCNHCGKRGHKKDKCSQLRECWNCGEKGHQRNVCKNKRKVEYTKEIHITLKGLLSWYEQKCKKGK